MPHEKQDVGVGVTYEKRSKLNLILGINIQGRIVVHMGRQGLGVNTLVPTLFISSHTTLDARASLIERRNVAGEGKHGAR